MIKQTPEQYANEIKKTVEGVFKTPQGKYLMEFLEQICHYNLPTTPTTQPYKDGVDLLIQQTKNEGKREIVTTLKTIMKWSPDQIAKEILKQGE